MRMLMKLRSSRHKLSKLITTTTPKKSSGRSSRTASADQSLMSNNNNNNIIEWEMRPGGMLVQKREGSGKCEEVIRVRVSTGFRLDDISITATATFGELKVLSSLITGLEPAEQRLLFKGKERENYDHLHMAGVNDGDKVLLLEDPAVKERKLRAMMAAAVDGHRHLPSCCHNKTIKV